MKCQTIEEKLSAYQDGELSVLEKEQVERHLRLLFLPCSMKKSTTLANTG
jgi:hypothetical protein